MRKDRTILLVTDDDAAGGTAAVSRLLATELASSHRLTLIYNQTRVAAEYFSSITASVKQVHCSISYWDNWRAAFDNRTADTLLDRNPCDLIIFSDCKVVGSHLALKEAAHARGIPYLMIVNGVPEHSREELGALIGKAICATNRAEAVVLVSQANLEALGTIYPEISSKRAVIPNSCDRKFFENTDRQSVRERMRRDLGLAPEQIVLLTAGRLEKAKGQHLIVAALKALAHRKAMKRCDLVYLIAGRPSSGYNEYFKTLVAEAGLDGSVKLLGFRSDIRNLMFASDIYVLTSFNEGAPISIIEAMAVGLPVIATSIDGIPEQVDYACGWLAPDPKHSIDECVAALAGVLQEICSKPHSIAAKGVAARQRAVDLFEPSLKSRRYADQIEAIPLPQQDEQQSSLPRKQDYTMALGNVLDMRSPERCWNYLNPGWSRNGPFGVRQLRAVTGLFLPMSPLMRIVKLTLQVNLVASAEIFAYHLLIWINGRKLLDSTMARPGAYSLSVSLNLDLPGRGLDIQIEPKIRCKDEKGRSSEFLFMPGCIALESITVE
jgi:glycosyltransferase involved in cell wall biosynthesis